MTTPLEHTRILVVEDEPLIGMALEVALSEAGADVTLVKTDRAAYAALERQSPEFDLLIADINLREGTTGFDVSRFARRLDATLPVIYLSGGSPDSMMAFGVAGAEFVSKPVAEQHLLSTAERLTGRDDPISCSMPHAT